MKKATKIIAILLIALIFTNCATILGGPINSYQKTKPAPGQQEREVRVVALIADILLFLPGTIVDFATGAIYKPH